MDRNHRILVIDDNRAIHEDFGKILSAQQANAGLDDLESALFGKAGKVARASYELDSAYQGQEGYQKVVEAVKSGRRYAMAFIDMRMPPGWDGVQTIEKVWEADPEIQVVICTAYSDYSWEDILAKFGAADRLLILKKPFDTAEVCQLACALTEKWHLAKHAHLKLSQLKSMVEERTRELERAYEVERERNSLRDAVRAHEQVLGVVGHELRTPLAAIRAMAEFLLTDGASSTPQFQDFLEAIDGEVVRMSAMVNDLLEVARLNSGVAKWDWSTISVAEACGEAVASVRPLVNSTKVALTLDVTPTELSMRGDGGAIRRMVLNLLTNACKFTHAGSIEVGAKQITSSDKDCIEIRISDTGKGIEPEKALRLGEAFALNSGVVGDRFVDGSGLGLAICRGIVSAHGGSISFESVPLRGTTVTVRLRANLAEPMTAPITIAVAPLVGGSSGVAHG
jgi:signal transduction histidine kinase